MASADVVYIGTDHTLDAMPARRASTPGHRCPRGSAVRALPRHGLPAQESRVCDGVVAALQGTTRVRRADSFSPAPMSRSVPRRRSKPSSCRQEPGAPRFVVDVAAVDEGEKRWLMRNATLMLYPSVHEGFGLVPFEAAELGLMCAFASGTSIAELLPSKLALIRSWDPQATAAQLAPISTPLSCASRASGRVAGRGCEVHLGHDRSAPARGLPGCRGSARERVTPAGGGVPLAAASARARAGALRGVA